MLASALARLGVFASRAFIDNIGSAVLALLLSLFIWMAAVIEQNPLREETYPGDLAIEVLNRPSSLVLVQPLERTARVRIRVPQAVWERLQPGRASAFVDLKDASAGLREFDVRARFVDPEITVVAVDPPRIALRLEERREKTLSLQVLIGDSPPIGFLVGTPQATPATALVSGPQSLVEQVVEVVAAVQLRGAKSTVEREVPLVARDAQGNAVAGVRLSPATAVVRVSVEQRLGFKDVSVRVVTRNSVASGYWLSNISVEPSTVTIVGSPAALDEIGGYVSTDSIDLRDARTSFLRRLGLVLPDGVSPVDAQTVLVTIDVSPIIGGQTIQRQATVRGLQPGLKVALSPETVDVILSGPLPVLQSLRLEDVQVIIDITGSGPGRYTVTPTVVKPDSLKVESIVPDLIQVTITR